MKNKSEIDLEGLNNYISDLCKNNDPNLDRYLFQLVKDGLISKLTKGNARNILRIDQEKNGSNILHKIANGEFGNDKLVIKDLLNVIENCVSAAECIKLYRAHDENRDTPFTISTSNGNISLMKELLNTQDRILEREGRTKRELHEVRKHTLSVAGQNQNTPLHIAALSTIADLKPAGEMIKFLRSNDVELYPRDNTNLIPSQTVIRYNSAHHVSISEVEKAHIKIKTIVPLLVDNSADLLKPLKFAQPQSGNTYNLLNRVNSWTLEDTQKLKKLCDKPFVQKLDYLNSYIQAQEPQSSKSQKTQSNKFQKRLEDERANSKHQKKMCVIL